MSFEQLDLTKLINVTAVTEFIPQQSDSDAKRFVFSYTITITNNSNASVQLLSRHWIIQDANRKIEEVYGEGVIGQQPLIQVGEQFSYTSGAVLETEIGTMEGRYFLILAEAKEDTNEFEIPIPKFTLSIPRVIH